MENLTPDEVLKAYRALPLEEQRQVLEKILEEGTLVTARNDDRFEREMQWIKQHRIEYAGQWVALDGDQLISHSTNAKEVFAAAEASGIHLPLVVRIEAPNEIPFGGW
ncbi:MAG: DUF5678 domain-containing protein [Acidobacteriota bacterium]